MEEYSTGRKFKPKSRSRHRVEFVANHKIVSEKHWQNLLGIYNKIIEFLYQYSHLCEHLFCVNM